MPFWIPLPWIDVSFHMTIKISQGYGPWRWYAIHTVIMLFEVLACQNDSKFFKYHMMLKRRYVYFYPSAIINANVYHHDKLLSIILQLQFHRGSLLVFSLYSYIRFFSSLMSTFVPNILLRDRYDNRIVV